MAEEQVIIFIFTILLVMGYRMGFNVTTPSATIDIGRPNDSATQAWAPLRFPINTNISTKGAGLFHFNGVHLYFDIDGSHQYQLDQQAGTPIDTSHLRADIDSLENHAVTGLFGDVASAGPGSSAAIVNGIKGKTIPSLAVGVLKYNGTSWLYDTSADAFADSVRSGKILDTIPVTHAGPGFYNVYTDSSGNLVDKTQVDGYGIISANHRTVR